MDISKSANTGLRNYTSNGVVTGVGTAFPDQFYTQNEIKSMFNFKNRVVNKLMDSGHIEKRHLYMDNLDSQTGELADESQEDLHNKFVKGIKDIGIRAIQNALDNSNVSANNIDQLIAVTSTGFLVPGMSSILSKELELKDSLHRADIVGMGCNAGMSALYSASLAIKAEPDITSLLVCVEINSAIYVKDETIRTGIVNSLFGDAAAALVMQGKDSYLKSGYQNAQTRLPHFTIKAFESFTINEQSDSMRFDYDSNQNKYSFFLSKDIPFVIGENIKYPLERLLNKMNIKKDEIAHYVMHTGGKAVIEGARQSLGLSQNQLRHTTSVLRDYGNVSSGSFIVSLKRLYDEGNVKEGDLGLLIAMGPGATIEVALIEFT